MKKNKVPPMDNKGSAMITAIVVGVVMAGFALSLLVITYTLYAQVAKRTLQIQCKYMAGELADELCAETQDHGSELYRVLEAHVYKERDAGVGGSWIPLGSPEMIGKSECLSYELSCPDGDELSAYEAVVDFYYTVGDTEDDESTEAYDAFYDRIKVPADELSANAINEEWDEMIFGDSSLGGGDSVLTVEVMVTRGDVSYKVTKKAEVEF